LLHAVAHDAGAGTTFGHAFHAGSSGGQAGITGNRSAAAFDIIVAIGGATHTHIAGGCIAVVAVGACGATQFNAGTAGAGITLGTGRLAGRTAVPGVGIVVALFAFFAVGGAAFAATIHRVAGAFVRLAAVDGAVGHAHAGRTANHVVRAVGIQAAAYIGVVVVGLGIGLGIIAIRLHFIAIGDHRGFLGVFFLVAIGNGACAFTNGIVTGLARMVIILGRTGGINVYTGVVLAELGLGVTQITGIRGLLADVFHRVAYPFVGTVHIRLAGDRVVFITTG